MRPCLRFRRPAAARRLDLELFDRSRRVGRVLAEARASAAGRVESVRIAELALEPAYAAYRSELLARWCDLLLRVHPHVPLEIEGDAAERERWQALDRPLLVDLGYRLDALEDASGSSAGGRFRSRWEPAPPPTLDPRALRVEAEHTVGGTSYAVRVIRCETHWARLEPFWDELLRTTPGGAGMQSYVFLRAWWSALGLASRLWIVTIWRGDELCGIAPLRIGAEQGVLRWVRPMTFIGTAFEIGRPTLMFGRNVDACLAVLRSCLANARADWDQLVFFEQAADAPIARLLPDLVPARGHLRRVTPSTTCPYIVLDRSFESYLGERSKQFRKQVRAARRQLEERGELRVTRISAWPEIRDAIERYAELETRSWKNGGEAAITQPQCQSAGFLRELLAHAGPKGALQVVELTLSGQPIAATIAFVHERHYFSLSIAHDAAWDECSPGNVLTYFELEQVHAEGYLDYDFLGTFVQGKLRWTKTTRDTSNVVLTGRDPYDSLVHLWKMHLAPPLRGALKRHGLQERVVGLQRRITARLRGKPPR